MPKFKPHTKKRSIVLMTTPPEVFGNFVLFCQKKGISHTTYAQKGFPFELKGVEVHRVYNHDNGNPDALPPEIIEE